MKVKSALQLVLAFGLLPFCSNIMAAQAPVSTDGGGSADFAWLLGAAVLGCSVVARRSPRPPVNPSPTPNTNTPAINPEQWLPSGALQ